MRTIIRNNYDPHAGDYHERIIQDEARGKTWLFDCDGVYLDITAGRGDIKVVNELGDSETDATSQKLVTDELNAVNSKADTTAEALTAETEARIQGDATLQQEIDDIKNSPDVVDIVATKAALDEYDTSSLGDNDIIRVLRDETHSGASTYYRWDATTSSFTYIGEVGDYYTKDQTDSLLANKVDKVAGKGLSENDFTDADKTKLDGIEAGAEANTINSISVNGTAVTPDANKNVDLTITSPTVVQTTGTSTTDIMSQNAVTSMVYADPALLEKPQIGEGAIASGNESLAIGKRALASGSRSIAIGARGPLSADRTTASGYDSLAMGRYARATQIMAVAVGSGATATRIGEFNIGSDGFPNSGYNQSNYRLLTGLYDPQNDHDAATKGYVDTAVANKQDTLTFDTTPTQSSTNPVTSGGVFEALAGAGGIKTLTTEDYDYHDSGSEDNSVALWRLPTGIYLKPAGINAHTFDGATGRLWDSTGNRDKIIIITPTYDGTQGITVFGGGGQTGLYMVGSIRVNSLGTPQGYSTNNDNYYSATFLTGAMVVDGLTSTLTKAPLSARQGRILNNNIGSLSTLTTTAKTSTVAAINELVSAQTPLTDTEFNTLWENA